ncbi:MAG: GNAT family N-acetyltransferase, partial [Chloroflexota bacterium]
MRHEPPLKDFFYSLSDLSLYRGFFSARKDMPHERLQDFVVIDYAREMIVLAVGREEREGEVVLGLGEYRRYEDAHLAEVALVVRDDYQGRGIGKELLSYLTYLAKKEGLLGFTA